MYKAKIKGIAHTERQAIDLEIATQEQLKLLYDLEEVAGSGHTMVEKVEAKKAEK